MCILVLLSLGLITTIKDCSQSLGLHCNFTNVNIRIEVLLHTHHSIFLLLLINMGGVHYRLMSVLPW